MAKYFKLEFKSHEATPIKIDDKIKEQCELRIKAKMREKRINLFASNDVDKSLLEILQNAIQKDNIFVQISDKIDENALNLRLIHNKNYYEKTGLDDPYFVSKNATLHHITQEDFFKKRS